MAIESGKYADAIRFTERALAVQTGPSWDQFDLLDALGAICARMGDLNSAKNAYVRSLNTAEQLARRFTAPCCISEAETAACWTTGSLGMVNFQLAQTDTPQSASLLEEATLQFSQQLRQARLLRDDLKQRGLSPALISKAKRCESYAMNRLLLCHATKGDKPHCIEIGDKACELSRQVSDAESPTLTHFLYGYALACLGEREKAVFHMAMIKPSGKSEDMNFSSDAGWEALDRALQPLFWNEDLRVKTQHAHDSAQPATPLPPADSSVPVIAAPKARQPSVERNSRSQQQPRLSLAGASHMLAKVLRLRRG
jgi:tetratricopeptide (TPR) repeat protein